MGRFPQRELPTSAEMTVPWWMRTGRPTVLFEDAALHPRVIDRATGRWRVQTEERYRKTPPSLVGVQHLAGPATARTQFGQLPVAAAAVESFVPDRGGAISTDLAELRRRAGSQPSLVDQLSLWVYETLDTAPQLLEKLVEDIHRQMCKIQVEPRDPAAAPELPFAAAGVHLLSRAPQIVHRAKLTSMLMQVAHDPQLLAGDARRLQMAAAADGAAFAASQGLFDGILIGEAYLGPLLGALTPHVWAVAAHRGLGAIIYSLGHPLAGTPGHPTELLHLLPSRGASAGEAVPTLPATAAAAALDWWAARLNAMFAVLTDPAVFTDKQRIFHPAKHLQALLTVEQLFRRVSSIQTAYRDTNARRVLLFTVLDTLDRLTGRNIETLCSLPHAQARLDAAATTMPPAARPILLPGAQRGIDAIDELEKGFYLRRIIDTASVEVPVASGIRTLKPHDATAEYVKVLRDATHGHGTNRAARAPISAALLAHHNGTVPHDLAMLGYLYLLDVLSHPEDLARRLHRNGAA